MIIDSFGHDGEWINLHLDPVTLGDQFYYLVSTSYAGEGSPSPKDVEQIASKVEVVPSEFVSIAEVCERVRTAIKSDTWQQPFLINGECCSFEVHPRPGDPYADGREAFLNGFHYSANPHLENTASNDVWSRGWGDCAAEFPDRFNEGDLKYYLTGDVQVDLYNRR